jgi:hypothetical protein
MDQPGRLERRQRDQGMRADEVSQNDEKSNSYPYVMITLGLAFVGFGASVGLTAGELVPFFVFMFPASVLLALGLSRLEQQRQKPSLRGSAKKGSCSRLSEITWAA